MAVDEAWERVVRRPEEACHGCEARFATGQEFVTSLDLTDEGFARSDRCVPCFEKLETEPFSFWRVRRTREHRGPRRLDFNYLTEFFRRLEGREDEHSRRVAWLVTLLLLRKKMLVEVGRQAGPAGEILQVSFKNDERVMDIADPGIDAEGMAALHEDLSRIFNIEET